MAITDAFMTAVEPDAEYELFHPRSKAVVGKLRAREVWEKIIHGAWKTGEPGVFFIDKANYYNPVPHLGAYEATNPCGEQPLLPYDVCNLGSINLGMFVENGSLDWDKLRSTVHLTTHFLENVIDANNYPLPEITDLAQRIRRIGLGVMGWADVLIKLGIPYDSEEAVDLGARVQAFVDNEAKVESERLATIRGTFAEWEKSIWGPDATCARERQGRADPPHAEAPQLQRHHRGAHRHHLASSPAAARGIEPLFAVAFMRNQAGVLMPDVNEEFVAIAKKEGWYSEALMTRIAEAGNINFEEVPEKWQRVFVTANHIKPEWHIRMQAGFQEANDSAISQDLQLRPRRHRGVRRGDLPAGVPPQLQGRDGLPRRQPRHAGAFAPGPRPRRCRSRPSRVAHSVARADLAPVAGGAAGQRRQ